MKVFISWSGDRSAVGPAADRYQRREFVVGIWGLSFPYPRITPQAFRFQRYVRSLEAPASNARATC